MIFCKLMKQRQAYRWGAKQYLSSMEVGETRRDDGAYHWRGLQYVAVMLRKEYGVRYIFRSYPKKGYREVTRVI